MALTPLTAAQKSLLNAARPAFDVTDGEMLTAARSFAALKADGVSFAALTAHVKATDWEYKPSKTRIYVLVTTYEGAPTDVTGKAFAALLKEAGTANREAGAAKREAVKAEKEAAAVTTDAAEPVTVPVTVESILALAWSLTPADQERLAAALVARIAPLTITV